MKLEFNYKEEWRARGLYLITREGKSYEAWLVGRHCVGRFTTLEEAKEALEREFQMEVHNANEKRA